MIYIIHIVVNTNLLLVMFWWVRFTSCCFLFFLHCTGHRKIIPKVLLMCVVAQVCQ